jgi:hypothetical protein
MIHYWQIQEHFYYIACCVLCSAHFLWCHDAKFCQRYSFCSMILLDTAATLVQQFLRLCILHCNSYKVIGLIQIQLKSFRWVPGTAAYCSRKALVLYNGCLAHYVDKGIHSQMLIN